MPSYTPESLFRGDEDLGRYQIEPVEYDLSAQPLKSVDRHQAEDDDSEAYTGSLDPEFYKLKDQLYQQSEE
jgi:hypothetical protein